jgi:quercetin dioxygenase-like cupin family protein
MIQIYFFECRGLHRQQGVAGHSWQGTSDTHKPITFHISNDLIHLGKIAVPPTFSESESHKRDELVYALEGSLTVSLPETAQSFEVREGGAFFVPEGAEHEYHNFTDKVIKAIFIVAPQL